MALALTGCATPYQEMGMLGGVQANQITHDTFQITARGNGYTDPDTIQRYALRKAVETTLAAGFDYFVIRDEADRSRAAQVGYGNATYHRGVASAFSYSGTVFKPGQSVMIKAYKGQPPEPSPPSVYNAHEIVQYMAGAGGFHGMSRRMRVQNTVIVRQ